VHLDKLLKKIFEQLVCLGRLF